MEIAIKATEGKLAQQEQIRSDKVIAMRVTYMSAYMSAAGSYMSAVGSYMSAMGSYMSAVGSYMSAVGSYMSATCDVHVRIYADRKPYRDCCVFWSQ